MLVVGNVVSKFSVAAGLLRYFWENKWWWLVPMIALLLVVGVLLIFAEGSAIAPFIYTLF